MHVAIDDRDPAYDALFDQPYGGDRQIVEHAIARTRVGERMMAASCRIGSEAVFERQHGGGQCPGHCACAIGDLLGHRKADPPRLLRRYPRFQYFGDIIGVMYRLQPGRRDQFGFGPDDILAPCPQEIADRAILAPAIGGAGGCLGDIGGVMDDMDHDA